MIEFKAVKKRMLRDPKVRQAYDALESEFAIARALIAARTRAGLTQADVAERMGTTQTVVSRMESGRALPSTRSLERYAKATGSTLRIELAPVGRIAA